MFGGTGDLALRKLLPGLCYRDHYRQLAADSRIIGVSCSQIDRDGYVREVEGSLRRYLPAHDLDEGTLAQFLDGSDHVTLDATALEGWPGLAAKLAGTRFEEAA